MINPHRPTCQRDYHRSTLETDTRSSWDMRTRSWDYQEFLRSVSQKIARQGKLHVLTGRSGCSKAQPKSWSGANCIAGTIFGSTIGMTGLARRYEVDFILRTAESVYLLETKADRDVNTPLTALKARAAQVWCEQMSGLRCDELEQPDRFEYLILSESLYAEHAGQSFTAEMKPAK